MTTLKQAAASLDSGKTEIETTDLVVFLNGEQVDEASNIVFRRASLTP